MNRQQTGFSIIELMVTLAVMSILLTVGVPSVRTIILNDRLAAATNNFVSSLNLARSEAVQQGVAAGICSSNNQTSCTASTWNSGWIIWVDADNDGVLDSPGEVMRVAEPLKGSIAVTAANTALLFNATGFSTTPGTLKICDSRTGNLGKQIQILTGGSVSLTTQVACP